MTQGLPPAVRELALVLWNYHRMNQAPVAADAILVLCSHDAMVAERGAELWLEGLGSALVFSGGQGSITRNLWDEPEAVVFGRIAEARGVPADRIILETESTNTGENVLFTRRLLAARGMEPASVLLVQKPYMERRAFATFRKLWPEAAVTVTSPQVSFDDYLDRYAHQTLTPADVVSIMVGDLQRLRLYPERGFQIEQPIPEAVWAAFERLVAAGYDGHLVAAIS